MAFTFPWPYSQGEWLAWSTAAFTVLLGLTLLLAPRFGLRLLGVRYGRETGATSVVRALLGGFPLGAGLTAIILAQPFIYLALGFSWAFAALGCLLSLAADGGGAVRGLLGFLATLVLAALPLAYALGFVP